MLFVVLYQINMIDNIKPSSNINILNKNNFKLELLSEKMFNLLYVTINFKHLSIACPIILKGKI